MHSTMEGEEGGFKIFLFFVWTALYMMLQAAMFIIMLLNDSQCRSTVKVLV